MLPLDNMLLGAAAGAKGTKYTFPDQVQVCGGGGGKVNGYTAASEGLQVPAPGPQHLHSPQDTLRGVESSATISSEINPTLSPNSSGVPLIINKHHATR